MTKGKKKEYTQADAGKMLLDSMLKNVMEKAPESKQLLTTLMNIDLDKAGNLEEEMIKNNPQHANEIRSAFKDPAYIKNLQTINDMKKQVYAN